MPKRFIVLEGIDGAGTTTQAGQIAAALNHLGESTLVTAEPNDTAPIGDFLRKILQHKITAPYGTHSYAPSSATLALLFAAARVDHYNEVIRPALNEGKWIICDRYKGSSLVYQGFDTERVEWIRDLNKTVPDPDMTLLLDIDPNEAAARRKARNSLPEMFETTEFQREAAARYPVVLPRYYQNVSVINVTALPIEAVTALCMRVIHDYT
jgi:dTMP kinase